MNIKPIGLATTLALTTLLAALSVPPVAADSCDDESAGWGDETASCDFWCNKGESLGVSASVDDDGSITGTAACSGLEITCVGHGDCDGATLYGTQHSGFGDCTATGNGGWWTHVRVYCWTFDAGKGVGTGRLEAISEAVGTQTPTSPVLDRLGERLTLSHDLIKVGSTLTSVVALTFGEGRAEGLACDADGCVPATPLCVVGEEGWSCSV